MTYTIVDAKSHVAKYIDEISQSYKEKCPVHFDRMWEVWQAGCWLNWILEEANCPDEERYNIGFTHGQQSVFGNTWEWAVRYVNEYFETGKIQDKPGIELADKINNKYIKKEVKL